MAFHLRSLLRCALFSTALVGLASPAFAQPQLVPIQGVLTDTSGNVVNGTDLEFTFRIYATPTGPVSGALFQEQILLDVLDGAFLHYLGQGAVLDLDLFDGADYYLGIQVGAEVELLPRIQLGTTPYAAYAANAGRVEWSSIQNIPADLADGDNDTLYAANAPLVLNVATNRFGLSNVGCAPGSGWLWNGTTWVCEPASQTTYTAGAGLSLAGTAFSINAPQCAANEYSVWTAAGWSCRTDEGIRTLQAGAGVAVLGNQIGIAADACAPGQYLTWDGAGFACVNDASATLAGGAGITVAGGTVSTDAPICGANQNSVWTALGWACRNDQTGITTLAAGGGISVVGNEISVSAPACGAGEYLSFNGTNFTCVADASQAINVGDGLGFSAGTIFVDAPVCQSGQFLQWDGTDFGCASDQTGITTLLAGNGIGTSGNTISIASPTCAAGQYLSWTGSAFTCVNDISAALSAGDGLQLAGTTLRVNAPSCQSGRFLQWNGTAWGCADDQVGITTIGAGNGISVSGNTVSVALAPTACGANQYLTWTGTGFGCKTDVSSALTGGNGIAISGGAVSVTAPTCQSGSFLQWTGTTWGCAADNAGLTGLTGANGITISGTGDTRQVGVSLGAACGANAYLSWNGTGFACKADVSSALSAGNGLSLTGTVLAVNAPACQGGSFLQWTGSAWGCTAAPTGITTLNAGNGIAVSGNTISVNAGTACGANQYLNWTGTGFVCKTDVSAALTFSTGIQLVGSDVRTAAPTCTAPQFSRWTGTAWTCATPDAGITTITGANGITVSGTGASRTIGYNITACLATQENRWNGTSWECVAPVTGGTGTAVSGRTVSLPGLTTCGAGSFQRWTGVSWVCEADQTGIGAVSGGTGVTVTTSGTTATVSLALPTCAATSYLRWTGASWVCTNPVSAGAGITVSASNQISLNVTTCAAGTANRWGGASWVCEPTGVGDREIATLRANSMITGGGVSTWDTAGNLSWTQRYIVISNGNGAHFSANGYFDINMPAAGTTIPGVGGAANATATAAGIPIPVWHALYYVLPIGSTSPTVASNFRLVNYTVGAVVPDNWLLLAVRNSDVNRILLNVDGGRMLSPGQRYNAANGSAATCVHNMTLVWNNPSFPTEHSIRISDTAGNVVFNAAGGAAGTSVLGISLPPGRYALDALDGWGDGWNGGTFSITSNANDGMIAQVLYPTLSPLVGGLNTYCRTNLGFNVVPDKCSQTTWFDISPDCSYAYANQRVLHGNVNSNGAIQSGGDFSSSFFTTGAYTINFTRPFMGIPGVGLTQNFGGWFSYGSGGNTRDNALIDGVTPTGFRAILGDGNGNRSNRNFTFTVIGY